MLCLNYKCPICGEEYMNIADYDNHYFYCWFDLINIENM